MTTLSEIAGAPAPEPERPQTILTVLGTEKIRKQLTVLAGKYMTPDRCMALMINAVRKTPKLMECDMQSVLGAMMASAALGLEPNTPTGQAYLLPYKRRVKVGNQWVDSYECQFIIGYRGFITLAYRSPAVASIEAEAIHENDHFDHLQGSKGLVEFRKALTNRGPLVGAYCLVKMKSGEEIAVTLPLEEIHKARECSETFKSLRANLEQAESEKDRDRAQAKFDATPWVAWEDSMAAKTAIRYLCSKRLPLAPTDPMQIAANIDEDPLVDFKQFAKPEVAKDTFTDGLTPPAIEEKTPERLDLGNVKDLRRPEPVRARQQTSTPPKKAAPRPAPPPATEPAEPPQDDGPTVEDALAAVKRGEFDIALDLAHTISTEAVAEVQAAIAFTKKKPMGDSLDGIEIP